ECDQPTFFTSQTEKKYSDPSFSNHHVLPIYLCMHSKLHPQWNHQFILLCRHVALGNMHVPDYKKIRVLQ
ncbi:hypothetical protein EBQ93_00290, partial [bacterium]|nr:hypothetical protein [bacterium]